MGKQCLVPLAVVYEYPLMVGTIRLWLVVSGHDPWYTLITTETG